MPESSDLSLMTDSVGKGRFSRSCHRSKLIGSGITGRGVDMRTISSEISTKPGDSVPTCTIDPDRMAV
jgi:hypothetical protein